MNRRPAISHRLARDWPMLASCGTLSIGYLLLIVAMLVSAATYTTPSRIWQSLSTSEVQYSLSLSLLTSLLTSLLALWVAIPTAYLLTRQRLPGRIIWESLLDVPIVLPPLVVGLCLLILFQSPMGGWMEDRFRGISRWMTGRPIGITYEIPAIILAQFAVAASLATRMMRVAFDEIDPRAEWVALTLGCNQTTSFWRVLFPQLRPSIVAAGTLAMARSLGEFGPVLVFAGATRMKTEVLPTTVFLELSVGNLEGAVAASLVMVLLSLMAIVGARWLASVV